MTTISSTGAAPGNFPPPSQRELTADQKSQITDLLSAYDPETLSEEDAKSIVSALKDAGIAPGKGFAEAFEAAGFDARDVGKLAGLGPKGGETPPPPPAQGAGQSLDTGQLQLLKDVLDGYDLSNLSEEDEENILTALREAGLAGEEGDLVSLTA